MQSQICSRIIFYTWTKKSRIRSGNCNSGPNNVKRIRKAHNTLRYETLMTQQWLSRVLITELILNIARNVVTLFDSNKRDKFRLLIGDWEPVSSLGSNSVTGKFRILLNKLTTKHWTCVNLIPRWIWQQNSERCRMKPRERLNYLHTDRVVTPEKGKDLIILRTYGSDSHSSTMTRG